MTDDYAADAAPIPSSAHIDTTIPHSARVWNFWLGGKDHYPADRVAAQTYENIYPQIRDTALAVRHFMARTVRYLAEKEGVRQFLDVGTGLPATDNTHEIAQRVAPDSRIVYVDNDPLVLAHARALLTSGPDGRCGYIDADMRDPALILREAARTLDLDQPVALLFIGVLGHIPDDVEALVLVRDFMAGLAGGSFLALADSVGSSPIHNEASRYYAQTGAVPYRLRSPEQVNAFFAGLEIVEPGIVPIHDWRPEPSPVPAVAVTTLGGAGRKPTAPR